MHDRVTFEKGQDIFLEGSDAFYVYIIEKGSMDVWKTEGPEKKILSTIGPGSILGEMAIIEKGKRNASVTATEFCVCIRVSKDEFENYFEKCPPFIKALIKLLIKNLKQYNDS